MLRWKLKSFQAETLSKSKKRENSVRVEGLDGIGGTQWERMEGC